MSKIFSGVAPANQTKRSQFMNFSQGRCGTKVQCESCFFRRENNTRIHQKMGEKFMNFSFWPFLWFGLPGRLLIFFNIFGRVLTFFDVAPFRWPLPCPSFPWSFRKYQGKPQKHQGFLSPGEPLKTLENKQKTVKKTKEFRSEKKTKETKTPRKRRSLVRVLRSADDSKDRS